MFSKCFYEIGLKYIQVRLNIAVVLVPGRKFFSVKYA